ncbi:MAG: hypothetical protein WD049_05285 [Candidatus Paceibacterota bacterium]
MGKRSKKKPAKWTDSLDPDEVEEAFQEAVVDCYGEDERASGVLMMAQQELQVPFKVRIFGEELDVVDVQAAQDDARGLDLIVERRGERYPVEARSVDLCEPFPDGHLFLAAYLLWKSVL